MTILIYNKDDVDEYNIDEMREILRKVNIALGYRMSRDNVSEQDSYNYKTAIVNIAAAYNILDKLISK